jgi:hypothetical protein
LCLHVFGLSVNVIKKIYACNIFFYFLKENLRYYFHKNVYNLSTWLMSNSWVCLLFSQENSAIAKMKTKMQALNTTAVEAVLGNGVGDGCGGACVVAGVVDVVVVVNVVVVGVVVVDVAVVDVVDVVVVVVVDVVVVVVDDGQHV